MPTVHLIIKGRVQGVFYRASAKEKARELGIRGWIKNTPEGNVEIIATGPQPKLDAFSGWCRKGPPEAIVTHVEMNTVEEEVFPDFRIVRS
jgi:acylphosphatase